MKLYHFSDNKNITTLKVNYFNNNSYTNNDYKISKLKRIFFYYDINNIEYRFLNKYRYTCKIDTNKIYNLNNDNLNLKNRYKNNIDRMLKIIKRLKYKGILYNIGSLCIVNLFYNINVKMEV